MKPLFLPAALVALALLAGCQNPQEARAREIAAGLTPYYETQLRYSAGYGEIAARLSRPGPGACTIALAQPENLAGMVYTLDENGIRVEYRALSFPIDPTGEGRHAPLLLAADALGALLPPEPPLPQPQGEAWTIAGESQNRQWTLLLDEAGTPVKLLGSGPEEEILLENFCFLG